MPDTELERLSKCGRAIPTVDGFSRLETSSQGEYEHTESPYFTSTGRGNGKTRRPLFDHFNARDLKTLFKCAASAWAATLLIFINPVLKNYGTAVFFAP